MKTKTAATHTPIHLGPNGVDIREADETPIVSIPYGDDPERAETWARTIIRAVNSHDALIKRIEILGRMLEKATGWSAKEIAETIAQAEGK